MGAHLRLVKPAGPKPPRERRRKPRVFSPDEEARLRAAIRTARTLFGGTWECLADAVYCKSNTVIAQANGRAPVSALLAVRLARALGKPLESLYRAPADASHCPTCGRSGAP